MSEIQVVRQVFQLLGEFCLIGTGFSIVLMPYLRRARRWAVRCTLLGVLCIAVSVFVTPGWLP